MAWSARRRCWRAAPGLRRAGGGGRPRRPDPPGAAAGHGGRDVAARPGGRGGPACAGAGALLIDERHAARRRLSAAARPRCDAAPGAAGHGPRTVSAARAARRSGGAGHAGRADRADRQQRAGTRRAARHPGLAGDAVGADPGRGDRDDPARRRYRPAGLGGLRRSWPRCAARPALSVARGAAAARAGSVAAAVLACLGWTGARSPPCLARAAGGSRRPAAGGARRLRRPALARFARDEWRARLLRVSFEQHLAPDVVRRIAADPAALRLRGELREITALFTDIEGFTGMTERAEPADLVALLDAYFDVAARIVTDHGGMVDKIVGDAIHAIFNAPFALDNHPQRAVACALALLEASEEVRRSPLGQRLRLGRTRIGIETGPAIVGDVGGSRKLDYTAHGNAMNAAARLEAANKELGSSICIGPGTAARLDPATLRQIGTLTLRGQSQAIACYTPVSLRSADRGYRRGDACRAPAVRRSSVPRRVRDVGADARSVTSTAVCTPTTVTAPRSTNTPNTPLLGPAKKRVPRTATGRRASARRRRAAARRVVVVQHGAALQHQHAAGVDQEAVDAQIAPPRRALPASRRPGAGQARIARRCRPRRRRTPRRRVPGHDAWRRPRVAVAARGLHLARRLRRMNGGWRKTRRRQSAQQCTARNPSRHRPMLPYPASARPRSTPRQGPQQRTPQPTGRRNRPCRRSLQLPPSRPPRRARLRR